MRAITFELCAETLLACLAARNGGAHRIELCANLDAGGLTPAPALVLEAIAHANLPVHAMVRPRSGDFFYSGAEYTTMRDTILHFKLLGASGVVVGVLHDDRTIDIERTRDLVTLARPMQVTFHRAFDETPNLPQALEHIVATGCDRILTAGGQPDVLTGAPMLAQLVAQAGNRIMIAAGGGLRHANAAEVSHLAQTAHFHGSLRRKLSPTQSIVDAGDVRSMLQILRDA